MNLRTLWTDLKDYLLVRLVYPRRYPGSRIESLVPPGLSVGRGTIIRPGVHLSPVLERIGPHAYVGNRAAVFDCRAVGAFSCLSWGVKVGLPAHPFDHVGTSLIFCRKARGWVEEDTFDPTAGGLAEIGADVLVSAGALVLSGVTIGHGAVVAAGAVVTEDVPPYAVVVGTPAKVSRYRFEEPLREKLLASRWWERDEAEIRGLRRCFAKPEEFLEAGVRSKHNT